MPFLRLGFEKIMEQSRRKETIPGMMVTPIDSHPFALYNPQNKGGTREVFLVGYPAHADSSVYGMTRLLAWRLAGLDKTAAPKMLRIINVSSSDNPNKKRIFYEVLIDGQTLMCGGCDNYSGAGSEGKIWMDEVFEFLAYVFEESIEIAEIDAGRGNAVDSELQYHIDTWHKKNLIASNEFKEAHLFSPGDEVIFKEELSLNEPLPYAHEIIGQVTEVRTVPNHCNCGMGIKTPIEFHLEEHCNLRLRHLHRHPQIVTAQFFTITNTSSGRNLRLAKS